MKQRLLRHNSAGIYLPKKALTNAENCSTHEYELYDYIIASVNSFALIRVLRMGAFFCLCESSPYSGAFHKNFFLSRLPKLQVLDY